MQPTLVVLVKHGSCAIWHVIEKRIRDAINEAEGDRML